MRSALLIYFKYLKKYIYNITIQQKSTCSGPSINYYFNLSPHIIWKLEHTFLLEQNAVLHKQSSLNKTEDITRRRSLCLEHFFLSFSIVSMDPKGIKNYGCNNQVLLHWPVGVNNNVLLWDCGIFYYGYRKQSYSKKLFNWDKPKKNELVPIHNIPTYSNSGFVGGWPKQKRKMLKIQFLQAVWKIWPNFEGWTFFNFSPSPNKTRTLGSALLLSLYTTICSLFYQNYPCTRTEHYELNCSDLFSMPCLETEHSLAAFASFIFAAVKYPGGKNHELMWIKSPCFNVYLHNE